MHALTVFAGGRLAECASVCLEERAHAETSTLTLGGMPKLRKMTLKRLSVTEQMKAGYDDPEEATEDGACGVAILLAKHMTGLEVVRRNRKGKGYDYCLGNPAPLDFSARLKVSGIRHGTDTQVRTRVREKREQTKQSDEEQGDLPAYAIVVEFGQPRVVVDVRIRPAQQTANGNDGAASS